MIIIVNILFWNAKLNKYNKDRGDTAKENIDNCIASIIEETECDVIVLAEYGYELDSLCNKIWLTGRDFKYYASVAYDKVKIIYDKRIFVEHIQEGKNFTLVNIKTIAVEFLLAGVHLPSNIEYDNDDREKTADDFLSELKPAYERCAHKKCIICGDFNADPYDRVMIKANKFHSVSNQGIVKEENKERHLVVNMICFIIPHGNYIVVPMG